MVGVGFWSRFAIVGHCRSWLMNMVGPVGHGWPWLATVGGHGWSWLVQVGHGYPNMVGHC